MWWIIWDWLEMRYESICGWNEIAMTIEMDMNCYDICWKVWLVYMRMIWYIRWIMWNGYDYLMIWIVMTYESVIVMHNEWHEFVMTIDSIWDCIDDLKMLIDIYIW